MFVVDAAVGAEVSGLSGVEHRRIAFDAEVLRAGALTNAFLFLGEIGFLVG